MEDKKRLQDKMNAYREKAAMIGVLGSIALFISANAQIKRIRVVDTILYGIDSLKSKAGIPNLKVKWNNLEFRTNNDGYIDFLTDVNDDNEKRNQSFLRITKQNNSLNFNFDGEASLKVYDLLGREIFTRDNSYNNINWNLDNLANGFYVYEVRRKDKVERGALIANFGNGRSEVYLKQNNKENIIFSNKNKSSGKLEKIVDGINLSIKDEDVPSLDGKSNLGEYFDIEANYSSLDSVPDIIHMIPVLSFDSDKYRNILHFIKYMNYDDGTGQDTKLRRFEIPIKIFRNAAQAPNQNYIAAFDSATSSSAPNSWETMTSFNYKDIILSKMNLFEEVNVKPDTGASMDYSSNLSHVIFEKWAPNNGIPLFARIYVDNSTSF